MPQRKLKLYTAGRRFFAALESRSETGKARGTSEAEVVLKGFFYNYRPNGAFDGIPQGWIEEGLMLGTKLHNSVEFDSVPTPEWFLSIFEAWHDPYPLGCEAVVEPPSGPTRIFCNPGYSRKEEAAARCIEWHKAGHFVVLLVPVESSTRFAKTLIQYGCERMFFERRIFPNCRGVELLVLTG